jgi:hypothetical protein
MPCPRVDPTFPTADDRGKTATFEAAIGAGGIGLTPDILVAFPAQQRAFLTDLQPAA